MVGITNNDEEEKEDGGRFLQIIRNNCIQKQKIIALSQKNVSCNFY